MTTIFNPKSTAMITNTVSVIDVNGNSLINDFIRKTGDVMEGNLIFNGNESKIVFSNGSSQSLAFDEGRIEQIDNANNIISNMSNDGNTLTISQNVEITTNLLIPDNTFPISKVLNLQNNFNTINTTLTDHATNIINMRVELDDIKNLNIVEHFAANDTSIENLNTQVLIQSDDLETKRIIINNHQLLIQTNQSDIVNINDTITIIQENLTVEQNQLNSQLINIQNLIDITGSHSNNIDLINTTVTNFSNELDNLATTQSISESKTEISNITTLFSDVGGLSTFMTNQESINNNQTSIM